MNLYSPLSAIIRLSYEESDPETDEAEKGYFVIEIDRATINIGSTIGSITYFSSVTDEPVKVLLQTAETGD